MDKSIHLLNSLKTRLTNLVTNKNRITQNEKLNTVEYSRLKAAMINDNILSGYAVNERTFHNNEVYAESNQEILSYHIYPLLKKSSTKEPEHNNQEEHLNMDKSIKIKAS
jgi:hypothetical protein